MSNSIRLYPTLILITLPVAVLVIGWLVLSVDPYHTTSFVHILFFIALFFLIWGLGSLIFSLPMFLKHRLIFQSSVPIRRGLLIALVAISILLLYREGEHKKEIFAILIALPIAAELFLTFFHKK